MNNQVFHDYDQPSTDHHLSRSLYNITIYIYLYHHLWRSIKFIYNIYISLYFKWLTHIFLTFIIASSCAAGAEVSKTSCGCCFDSKRLGEIRPLKMKSIWNPSISYEYTIYLYTSYNIIFIYTIYIYHHLSRSISNIHLFNSHLSAQAPRIDPRPACRCRASTCGSDLPAHRPGRLRWCHQILQGKSLG